jgi:hypothetical protein
MPTIRNNAANNEESLLSSNADSKSVVPIGIQSHSEPVDKIIADNAEDSPLEEGIHEHLPYDNLDNVVDVNSVPSILEFEKLVQVYKESCAVHGTEHSVTLQRRGQMFVGLLGALAMFLYFDPAALCAKGDPLDPTTLDNGTCDDAWLKSAIENSDIRQYIYFLSGGLGYAATNVFFSIDGVKAYLDMLVRLQGACRKVLATGGVATFVLLQGVQIYIAAKSSDSNVLNMSLSVAGSLPGAVYGGVRILNQLPSVVVKVTERLKQFCHFAHISRFSAEELQVLQLKKAKEIFYAKQRQEFNAVITAKWKQVVASARTMNIGDDENTTDMLMSQTNSSQSISTSEKLFQGVMQGVGVTLATSITVPAIYATNQALTGFMNEPVTRLIASNILSATMTVGNFALINKGANAMTNVIVSTVQGKPVNSLVYQLHPWLVGGVVVGGAAISALSYAVLDRISQKMWPSPSAEQDEWYDDLQPVCRGTTRAAIAFYHAVGLIDICMKKLSERMLKSGSAKDKFFARMEQEIAFYTSGMSQDEFIKFVEDCSPAVRGTLHVDSWDDFLQALQNSSVNPVELFSQQGLSKFKGVVCREVGSISGSLRHTLLPPPGVDPSVIKANNDFVEEFKELSVSRK